MSLEMFVFYVVTHGILGVSGFGLYLRAVAKGVDAGYWTSGVGLMVMSMAGLIVTGVITATKGLQ